MHCGAVAIEASHDPATALPYADEAIRIGVELGVLDLEILGLALRGLALVSQGEVEEGMPQLDEASIAASSGELQEIFSISWTFCYLIYACEYVRDFDRAAQWCQQVREFSQRFQFRFPMGICRAHYAGVLLWRGQWEEAEAELRKAQADLEASRPPQAVGSLVRLEELRRRQGQFREAEALFGKAGLHPLARLGQAELASDQGKLQRTQDLLERYHHHLPALNRAQRIPALELQVRVFARKGDLEGCRRSFQALAASAAAVPTQAARGSLLRRGSAGPHRGAAGEGPPLF